MIEYAFLQDHVSGGTLVVLTLSLVVFAVHVPMLVGFTVARYADSEASCGRLRPSSSSAISRTTTTASGSAANRTAMTSTWWRRRGSSRTS